MTNTKVQLRGMHCKSCAMLIEDKLKELEGVQSVHVNFRRKEALIRSESELAPFAIALAVRQAGYDVGEEAAVGIFSNKLSDYRDVVFSMAVVLFLYFVFSRLGAFDFLTRLGSGNPQSLVMVVLLGLTAGFSTCMAVVGGLLLAVSARHAEKYPKATLVEKFRPHLFFNLGRLVSYVLLGGLVGLIGEAVQLSSLSIAVLTLAVGAVMLLLGFQLTELFPRLKKLSISLPPAIGRFFGIKKEGKEYSHRGSFVAGALTFFLPCGFTQAMQLFALSTGSFTSGAMIMGAFALGTVPGLLSLGGVASAVQGSFARSFYKFTGVVVIVFAFITISNGLVLSGIKPYISSLFAGNTRTNEDYQRLFNSYAQGYDSPDRPDEAGSAPVQNEGNVQVIKTTFLSVAEDISPKIFTVERGKPVKFLVEVKENGRGCMSTIMVPGLYNRPIYLEQGKTLALEFTPERPGTYDIACAMGVTRGSIIVK